MNDVLKVKTDLKELSWIEIDEERLRHNISLLRNSLGKDVIISAVIKGNAYGHGMIEMASLLMANGINHFAVFHAGEALKLRQSVGPDAVIFQLGYTSAETVEMQLANDIHSMIIDVNQIDQIADCIPLGQRLKVQLKVNTGMNRFGIRPENILETIDKILSYNKFDITGLASHFADSWNYEAPSFGKSQQQKFKNCLDLVRQKIELPTYYHMANSGGIQVHEDAHFQLSRTGINLYGYYSHKSLKAKHLADTGTTFKPILAFRSRIVSINRVYPGEFVGYDRTFEVNKEMDIAIMPIGYTDGFPFLNGEHPSYVLIRGQRAPVVGRVNMNMVLLDVTNIESVAMHDVVTILGKDGTEEISAWDWREWGSSHLYESLTKLRMDLPRRIKYVQ